MVGILRFFKLTGKFIRGFYLAIRLLLKPEDTPTLLKLGNLLTDLPAYSAALGQLKANPEIKKLIDARYSPGIPTMTQLKSYPEGSLGKAYYNQLSKYNLEPYVALPTKNESENVYLRERSREIHDIIHTVLGCGITVEEEAQVNAFNMVKGATPFTSIIVVGAILHFIFKRPSELPRVIELVKKSWDLGEKLKSPFEIKWEEYFARPMEEVQREMGFTIDSKLGISGPSTTKGLSL